MAIIFSGHFVLSTAFRGIRRLVSGALACTGALALLLAALQFTRIPWKAYSFLACDGAGECGYGSGWAPTHILVMGGSGVPGESALMRLWYAADAASRNPGVPVWMALPCSEGDNCNPAADAYAGELLLRGVEEERCEPRACGNNTREQAVALVGDLGMERGWEGKEAARVLVVTSPEHVRRACLAVRRAARDAGAAIEVRGQAAESLSIDDHGVPARAVAPKEQSSTVAAKEGGCGKLPSVFRYDFWNHAQYTLLSAREFVALLYYRTRGWI